MNVLLVLVAAVVWPSVSSLNCYCNLTAPAGDLGKTFKETGMAKTDAEAQQMLTEMQCTSASGQCSMRSVASTAPLQPVCVLTQIWTEDRKSSQMMSMCTYYPTLPSSRIQQESCLDSGSQVGGTKMRFCTSDNCNTKIDCAAPGKNSAQVKQLSRIGAAMATLLIGFLAN